MKQLFILISFSLVSLLAFSQENYTVSGYISDKGTGEVLIGATVFENNQFEGTTSNEYGFYSLTLPKGNYVLVCSYLGYNTQSFEINFTQNISKDISLIVDPINLEFVTITASSEIDPLSINEFNIETITQKKLRQLPIVLGKGDVIKAVQLQSGVKTLGDGSSGMFVRGGNSDQNLILIDEAPIYNPSHLFGLISIFNPSALNHVTLYKSNMPAQYGGRVSSVIDCKMKEGNMNDHNFSAGISLFSTFASVNGPIVKEKSSYFVSVRRSFIDLFFKPGSNLSLVPVFYDLNVKTNVKIGKNDRLFMSFYNGKDLLESTNGFYNKWGNTSGTLRWNRNFGSQLFLNTSFIVSDYRNYMEFNDINQNQNQNQNPNYKWLTGLSDINLKLDLSYYIRPGNLIRIGAGSIYHKFTPGETSDSLQSIPRSQAFEYAAFVLNDVKPYRWLGVNYGIRLSAFHSTKGSTWFDYNELHEPIGKNINNEEGYKTKVILEPRVNVNIRFNSNYLLKLAYARNAQYMQVLQNNSLSYSSLETWFPTNPNIKPIVVDVISTGWFHRLSKDFFLSTELYYKAYQNQIDYIDHARLVNNPYIEGEVRSGTAKSYGAEINLKKESGSLTGNISYTYSRALRKIDEINSGQEYNSPFDIPHDFRIVTNYKINSRWSFSSIWMYTSGRPLTLPVSFYSNQKTIVPIYSDRNSSRFPNYHRLDIAFNYELEKKANWNFSFGLFNLYGRKNPIGYDFDVDFLTGEIKVYQYTLFSIMPNFSIEVDFGGAN